MDLEVLNGYPFYIGRPRCYTFQRISNSNIDPLHFMKNIGATMTTMTPMSIFIGSPVGSLSTLLIIHNEHSLLRKKAVAPPHTAVESASQPAEFRFGTEKLLRTILYCTCLNHHQLIDKYGNSYTFHRNERDQNSARKYVHKY